VRDAIDVGAAVAVGPYSHAVRSAGHLFCSGQTPLDSATGALVSGGVSDQTRQCFVNLFAVLDAAGLGPADVVKCNVYLTNMADFAAMNEAYESQFEAPYPARTTVAVVGLPLGASVEIELVAASASQG
jgi:2-iminobutanoate/2-iminopropanoate deaminase